MLSAAIYQVVDADNEGDSDDGDMAMLSLCLPPVKVSRLLVLSCVFFKEVRQVQPRTEQCTSFQLRIHSWLY